MRGTPPSARRHSDDPVTVWILSLLFTPLLDKFLPASPLGPSFQLFHYRPRMSLEAVNVSAGCAEQRGNLSVEVDDDNASYANGSGVPRAAVRGRGKTTSLLPQQASASPRRFRWRLGVSIGRRTAAGPKHIFILLLIGYRKNKFRAEISFKMKRQPLIVLEASSSFDWSPV